MLRFLFASDSFKGTLTSARTAELLTKAAHEVFDEVSCCAVPVADGGISCCSVPVADGGEGTVTAVVQARHGRLISAHVHNPLMERITAQYGIIDDRRGDSDGPFCGASSVAGSSRRAVIEMSAASGLTLIRPEQRNPLKTTTFGTGELIRNALDQGCRDLSIAIGGSATNDGGMGCFRALGARFLDVCGLELEGCGADLERVASIDLSGLDPRLKESAITVMCDVTNPLCGHNGATFTFGPQKGAGPEDLKRLEKGMINYRNVINRQFANLTAIPGSAGIEDLTAIPGSGAAGGLGAALAIFAGAKMQSGIETILDLIDFDRKLDGVDLVITGEGCTDAQSSCGKVLQGVGEHARRKGIPVIALSGSLGKGYEEIYKHGICSVMTCVDRPMPLDEALLRAEELYYKAAVRMFRMIRAGAFISRPR